jgi:hypothetical protein
MAACLIRSFWELAPTHHVRLTAYGMISDRELTLAHGRFLSRLKYRLRALGSTIQYLLVNEWSDGQRHVHILVRTDFDLTSGIIRDLWAKSLPGVQFTHHCAPVRSPTAIARYVVKNLKDDAKKELPPRSFRGRIFTYSRGFFTKPVAALWKEQLREWYAVPQTVHPEERLPDQGSDRTSLTTEGLMIMEG